jgi:hypothetical protein
VSPGGGLGGLARTVYTSHRPPLAPSLLHPTNLTPQLPLSTASSSRFQLLFFCQGSNHSLCPFWSLILDVVDIVTMLASPKVLSSTTQQATISSKRSSLSKKHHQTVYDDGRSQYIIERRRRSDTVLGANAVNLRRRASSKVSQRDTMTTSENLLSSTPRSYPSSKDAAISRNLAARDGLGKKSGAHRAVVITTATPNITGKHKASDTWVDPTPPPTPRMKRLPTPELSDLGEEPFCYCDDPTTVTYYRACKRQTGSGTGWI